MDACADCCRMTGHPGEALLRQDRQNNKTVMLGVVDEVQGKGIFFLA